MSARLIEYTATWYVVDETTPTPVTGQSFHEWAVVHSNEGGGHLYRLIAHGDSYKMQSYVQLDQWVQGVGWAQVIREADPTPEIGGGYVGVDNWTPKVVEWFNRLLRTAEQMDLRP